MPRSQVAAQGERLQRGHAHALAVDRVEAAHRITDGEESGGEAVQQFVAVSDAGGEAEADRVIQRLGVADRLVDVGEPKRPGEIEEAVGVGGRVVTKDAGQRQHPPIAFEPLQGPGPRKSGCRGVQDGQLPSRASGGSR